MSTYTIGQQVEHKSFGHGTVIGIEGQFLVIEFVETGVKRTMAQFFTEGTYVAPVAAPEVEEVREVRPATVQEVAQTVFAMTGQWDSMMNAFAGRVAAAAEGNATMTDIISKWRKYHTPSPAQASAIARFAKANNITL